MVREKLQSPRKRRRRAPATGAANDCFTCQELQRKCDRRRPYCTQCLEHGGRDCSGYKTALTWNIGVASRGKLRGLALPIATSEKVSRRSIARGRKRRTSTSQSLELALEGSNFLPTSPILPSFAVATCGTRQYSFVNMDPKHSVTSPTAAPPTIRCHSAPQSTTYISPRVRKRVRRHSLKALLVPALNQIRGLEDVPTSADVSDSYNSDGFRTSVECSPSQAFFATPEPHHTDLSNPLTSVDSLDLPIKRPEPTRWSPKICCSLSSDQNGVDCLDYKPLPSTPVVTGTMDNNNLNQPAFDVYGFATENEIWRNTSAVNNYVYPAQAQTMNEGAQDFGHWTVGFPQPLSFPSGPASDLRFLVDYYDKVVPPVPTTPSNPYKAYILRLAAHSGSLQHAIAALSANHIRQRSAYTAIRTDQSKQNFSGFFHDEFIRRYSTGHNTLDCGRNQTATPSLNERSTEELCYKESSLGALNDQLADPNRRTDDPTRATILILCLYHIYDMGVERLKRQFTEVTSIFPLEGERSTVDNKATTWLSVVFTWFDSMILPREHDKEPIAGTSMHLPNIDADTWTSNNLAGYNGKLLSIVKKLKGLNLASGVSNIQHVSFLQVDNFGYGQMPSPADRGYDFYSINQTQNDGTQSQFMGTETDFRVQWWRRWNEIRTELEGWTLEDPSENPTSLQAEQLRQLNSNHVLESFRYATLLYMQRLAYPRMAAMQPNAHTLVERLLYHVSNVSTDISLLIPLFITTMGSSSEQTCHYLLMGKDMQEEDSGFLQNLSALELLHHLLWQSDEGDTTGLDFNSVGLVDPQQHPLMDNNTVGEYGPV